MREFILRNKLSAYMKRSAYIDEAGNMFNKYSWQVSWKLKDFVSSFTRDGLGIDSDDELKVERFFEKGDVESIVKIVKWYWKFM